MKHRKTMKGMKDEEELIPVETKSSAPLAEEETLERVQVRWEGRHKVERALATTENERPMPPGPGRSSGRRPQMKGE